MNKEATDYLVYRLTIVALVLYFGSQWFAENGESIRGFLRGLFG